MIEPRPRGGRWSTYTVLGLIGYAVAAIAIGVIGASTGASIVERAMAIALPPFGFWFAIAIERRITGVEQIGGGVQQFAAPPSLQNLRALR